MAAIAAVLSVVSGAVGAVGAIQSANAQASAAEYNAKIDERNKIIAQQDRKNTLELSAIEADDKRKENARTLSSIRAAYGSSGLDMAGSPLDVIEDTAIELSLDTRRIEYEGRARAREGYMKAQSYGERATLNRMEAKSARAAGPVSAFGYLAGGVGNALARIN